MNKIQEIRGNKKMNTNTYECSYVEVLEILKHIPQEQYNRIPKEKILFYEKNKNREYKYIYNEQMLNLSRKANAILENLYKEYIADSSEKKKIENILDLNNKKQEIEKQKKFNNTDLFKNRNNNESTKNVSLIEYSDKYTWYMKLIDKIKSFFRK